MDNQQRLQSNTLILELIWSGEMWIYQLSRNKFQLHRPWINFFDVTLNKQQLLDKYSIKYLNAIVDNPCQELSLKSLII